MDLFSRHFLKADISRCSPPQMFLYKGGLKISSKVTGEHPCRKVNYWNHASAWVLSCKFTVHCQNIFSKKHLWGASSVFHKDIFSQKVLRNIAVKLLLRFFPLEFLFQLNPIIQLFYPRCRMHLAGRNLTQYHHNDIFIMFSISMVLF